MPVDLDLERAFGAALGLSAAQFLCLLVRITAAMSFVPLPGMRQAPNAPRIMLAIAIALLVAPALTIAHPAQQPHQPRTFSISDAVWSLPAEAALGVAAGVAVGWILELFSMGMQILSLQAGYSYASMIDPATQADSGVLQVAGQLAAGLLFVSLGWEREVLAAFASSLEHSPLGSFQPNSDLAAMIIRWTASMITLAFRLALPVTALLLLLDMALALLGRTQPQMALINLALPLKMGATILLMALQASSWPALAARATSGLVEQLARIGLARPHL